MVQFAIETNCPSNDSGLTDSPAIVTVAGTGAVFVEGTRMPYGDVRFSTDSVMSRRRRPPLNPILPNTSTTWPGVVDVNAVAVSVDRYTLTPAVASWT